LFTFMENMEKAEERNRQNELRGGGAVHGVTQFMDMSSAEFKATMLMKSVPSQKTIKAKPAEFKPEDLPASFDWRDYNVVTDVKDQGQCGSCWAFGATENMESQYAMVHKNLTKLAVQQLMDCDLTDNACVGGDPPSAYRYIQQTGGFASEAAYGPYIANRSSCVFTKSMVVAKVTGYKSSSQLVPGGDETIMAENLMKGGPLCACLQADPFQTYTSGILMAAECLKTEIDHCIQVVGFVTTGTTPYWIVRNSWGADWGLNGYIWVQMGKNTCQIHTDVTTSIVA